MNKILAEIVACRFTEPHEHPANWETKLRLREIREGDHDGLYVEVANEFCDGTPVSFRIEPWELDNFCQQVSRALTPHATGTEAVIYYPTGETKEECGY